MARDAELRGRITAKDDASKVIDKVAHKADDLDSESVEIPIEADSSGLDSVLDALPGKLGDIGGLIQGLGSAGGIGALVGGLAAAGMAAADLATEAQTMATLTGDTVENASRLQNVWKGSGADVNDLNDVVLQMNGVLSTTPDIAKKLGVNLNDGRTIGQRFVQVVDLLQNSTLGAADKALLMSQVFGEEGVRQVATLTTKIDGPLADAIDNVADTQVISPADVERAQELSKETAELKAEFAAATQAIGEGMIPLLIRAAQLAGEIGKGLPGGEDQSPFNVFGSKKSRDDMKAISDAAHGVITATVDWEAINAKAADTQDDTNRSLEEGKAAMKGVTDAMTEWAVGEQIEQAKELADAMLEIAAAAQHYQDTIAGVDWAGTDLDGAVSGMTAFHDQFFSLANIAADNEAAFDAFGKSLEDNGKTFDLNTEKGRDNQKALENLASTIDLQLAAVLRDSGGNLDTFKGKAATVADTLKSRLQHELGLSGDRADDMIRRLGLLPEDIETRYELSGVEEARAKLDLLSESIDDLPDDVKTKVTQEIIAGDYQGALSTVQNYYNRNPATVKLEVIPPKSPPRYADGRPIIGNTMAPPPPATGPVVAASAAAPPVDVPVRLVLSPGESAAFSRRIGKIPVAFDIASGLAADHRVKGVRT